MLEIKAVSVAYGNNVVVQNASLQLAKGDIGCFLGPSGCGKTTLLRAIAGFEPLKQGEIFLDGDKVSDQHAHLVPEKRNIGMVFQDFALFPHLNIADNIAFGMQGQNQGRKNKRIKKLLQMVSLEHYGDRYPHELSGGQQQRVALIRALAPKPDLLLLDEPFSSMDIELREELATEVRDILKHEQITALFVTHDQNEAFIVADSIGVMREGKLLQWANGYDLYHEPANPFVAKFIGRGVFIDGEVVDQKRIKTTLATVSGKVPNKCRPGCKVDVFIRPDDIIIDPNAFLKAMVVKRDFRGSEFVYTLKLSDGAKLLALENSHSRHEEGDEVGIAPQFGHVVVFPKKGQL